MTAALDDLAAGARGLERARDVARRAAAGRPPSSAPTRRPRAVGIVDRRDAALRRAGPEPGAEQEIEGAPVEQRLEDLLARACRGTLWGSPIWARTRRPATTSASSATTSSSTARPKARSGEWPTRRSKPLQPRPAQQQARDIFRGQAGHHDAQQQERGPAADDVGQAAPDAGPAQGSASAVNSSRSVRSVRNDPVAPSALKAVSAAAEPAHAAAKPPSAAALANLDRVIVFPRRMAGKA